MERETIKDFYGRILGYIETQPNGDKIVKDFYGRIKGKYEKQSNTTKDFYGRILSKGDISSSLIYR